MRLNVKDVDKCIGCQSCMFACARRKGEAGLARSSIGIRSAGGMERGFIVVVCRACSDPPCARVCPTDALVPKEDGGVKLDITKPVRLPTSAFWLGQGIVIWIMADTV